MKVLMSLDQFANRCGHFFNCNLAEGFEDGPDVNNGYNCNHPDCGDEEDGIGCCRADTCPLAYPANGVTCKLSGVQCSQCGDEECTHDCDMMVVEISEQQFNAQYMIPVVEEG